MSTFEEFEAAPVGATATRVWKRAVKTFYSETDRNWLSRDGECLSAQEMAEGNWTLDPAPAAPTTAREALDLAWDLAHPIKEGQELPEGTWYVLKTSKKFITRTLDDTYKVSSWDEANVRTLDPLPEPEPDWLDAPAVLASTTFCDDRMIWTPERDHEGWSCDRSRETRHWSDLRDVTPLYPKGQDA